MTLALLQRRALLLQAAGGLAASSSASSNPGARGSCPPGRPGEFDFLTGEWHIHNRRPKTEGGFDEFPGEATVTRLLDGAASIEELRIPAKGFAGLGLRCFDPKARLWRDIWMNAKDGIVEGPGMPGHFVDGAGIFEADDKEGETPIKVRGIWDQITPRSCRWRQGVSRDGGVTWEFNWWMDWTRA